MNESKSTNADKKQVLNLPRPFSKVVAVACVGWTVALLLSYLWNYHEDKADLEQLVHETAHVSLEKDLQYRLWAANHGGVYVPVTEKTPPNPLLSHIKERDITTPSGKKLTLVNPAYMSRQVFEQERKGIQIQGHLSSLKPLRSDNKPDDWETKAFSAIERGQKEFGEIIIFNTAPHYRLLLPLLVKKPCLNCHGAQGFKVGDLCGGISTAVPMEPYQLVERSHERANFGGHVVIWMLGLAGLTLSALSIKRRIAERARAEEALRESEARYRTIIEHSNDMIWTLDLEGNFLFFNQRSEEITGYKSADWLGKSFATLIKKEELPRITEIFRKTVLGQPQQYEISLLCQDGRTIFLLVNTTPMYSKEGISGTVSFGKDITDRVRAEKSLQESEARFRELANALPQPVFEADKQGIISFMNQCGYDLFGYTPDEITLGIDVFTMIVEEDRKRAQQNVARLLAGGGVLDIEYTARRKNGSAFPVIIYTSTIVRGGTIAGFRGIVVDYTERKNAIAMMQSIAEQVSVKTGEDFFRTVTEYIAHDLGMDFAFVGEVQEGGRQISTIDFYGEGMHRENIVYALEDTPCESIAGKTLCIYPSEARRIFPNCTLLKDLGIDGFIGSSLRNENGQLIGVFAAMSTSSLEKETVERGISLFRILGTRAEAELERKRQEAARHGLEAQLLQSRKMESVGLLAGGVAHDINNMLTPILGYTELLANKITPDDPLGGSLGEISDAAQWIKTLVQQLLAFAQRQTLEMKLLDVNAVINRFMKMLHFTIRENIKVELRLGSSQGSVMGDAGQVEQIILNLAVNAQDAMPEGGVLLIETADVVLDGAFAQRHENIAPGLFTMMAVSDTGSGMDASIQSRIFDPFFTTKNRGKGMGLGLATVYGIVKQHGGCIEVISAPGTGTTFRTYFPRACQMSTEIEHETMKPSRKLGTETILVAEDEELVLRMIKEMLSHHGYQVLAAGNGKKALEMAMSHQGDIHLLITDVVMTDMNGRVLFEQMADAGKCMNVLYMSAHPEDVISKHGVLDSGVHFIRKPFSIQGFTDKMREVLEHEH